MANNILYLSDGNYGTPGGYLLPLVQGQFGQSVPLEIRDLAGNVVPLTGYSTITGHKRKGGSVTAIVGVFTLSGTPTVAPQITWVIDEDDTGQDGAFSFFLEITNGSIVYTTHPVSLTITKDPAVNATAAPGLVGVLTSWRALLGALYSAAQAATSGQVFVFDGDGSGAQGDAAGGGSVDTVFGRGGPDVVAEAGDYAASEITDDSGVGGATVSATLTFLSETINDLDGVVSAKQDYSAKLAAIDALTWAANSIILLTGTATASIQALAAHVVTFLQSASVSDARAAIGALPIDANVTTARTSGYTFQTSDRGATIPVSGTFTFSLPDGMPNGAQAVLIRTGAGTVTLSAATTLVSDGTQLSQDGAAATVIHLGSNIWYAFGKLT